MIETKIEVKEKLINFFDHLPEGVKGYEYMFELKYFIEREKICPELVIQIVDELVAERHVLPDGRYMIKSPDYYSTAVVRF
jgi:hypothetical protein